MKKNWIIAAIAVVSLFSCKSDDDGIQGEPPVVIEPVEPVEPAILTPTEAKQKLEDNSLEVLNKVEDFRNDTALKEVEEFLNFLFTEEEHIIDEIQAPVEQNAVLESVKNTMLATTQVKHNKISATKLPSVLLKNIVAPSKTNLEIDFNEIEGVHTWNAQKDDFDYVANQNGKIVFNVTQNGKTASLTISNFTAYTHASGEEAPKSIKAELKVDGTKIMGVDYSAAIADNDYLPTNVSASLTLGTLSYNATLNNNNNSESSINQSLNIGDTKILGLDLSGKGNYADVNTTGDSDKALNLLLNSANTTFSIGETKISIDGTAPATVQDNYTVDEEVQLLNDILNVSITSGDSKIANGEFYKKSELQDVYDYNEVPKFVVEDINYNQVELFDTAQELKNSIYYRNYNLYYNPVTIIEENVTINNSSNIWDYIYNKYPHGYLDGKHISPRYISDSSNETTETYTITYNLYTTDHKQQVILEENIRLKDNEDIWDYIHTKYNDIYPHTKYSDVYIENGSTIRYQQNYYYKTDYVYNPNGPNIYEPVSSNWYAVEKLVHNPSMNLLFEDGSESTMEAYFEVGFEDLINNAEEIANAYSLEEEEVIEEIAN